MSQEFYDYLALTTSLSQMVTCMRPYLVYLQFYPYKLLFMKRNHHFQHLLLFPFLKFDVTNFGPLSITCHIMSHFVHPPSETCDVIYARA